MTAGEAISFIEKHGVVLASAKGPVPPSRAKAEAAHSADFSPLWSGQNAGGCREVPAAQIVRDLTAGLKEESHARASTQL
jgi:hypothetical protein